MTISTSKVPELSPTTAALVEACQRLKAISPDAWNVFLSAYGDLLDLELQKLLDEPGDGYAVARAQGRVKFANVLGQTLDKCTELNLAHRQTMERRAKNAAEQARNKGTLLNP